MPDPKPASTFAYTRWAFWTLGAVTLVRLLYLWVFPYRLSGDEAYYWDWGRQLAGGYYSKPPLIAWLMALAEALTGGSPAGLRSFAVLCGSGSALLLFVLARRLYGARVAFFGLLLLLASPGNVALNLFLTIDAPLLLFWSLALYSFWRWIDVRGREALWLLVLMVALGLGYLTKQMMLVFPVLMLAFLLLHKPLRPLLRDVKLYLALGGSLLFLLPPLLWNARNDWITFAHTAGHVAEEPGLTLLERLSSLGEFAFQQAALMNLLIWPLLLFLCAYLPLRWRRLSLPTRFLWCFSAPGLLVFTVLALEQRVLPNWPAAFYPAGLLLASAWCLRETRLAVPRLAQGLLKTALGLGLVLALLTCVYPFFIRAGNWEGSRFDPAVRLAGWPELARAVQALRDDLPQPEATYVLTHGHRYLAAQLAYELPDQPQVFRWAEPGTVQSQYELWPRAETLYPGHDILIVQSGTAEALGIPLPEGYVVTDARPLQIVLSPHRTRHFMLYVARKQPDTP